MLGTFIGVFALAWLQPVYPTPLGTFTSIYKFLINALPILIPALSPPDSSNAIDEVDDLEAQLPTTTIVVPTNRRKARLSLSARTQLILIRKRTRRWHAALAGAIAGALAIVWEKRTRRGLIAQQLFVRLVLSAYLCIYAGINTPLVGSRAPTTRTRHGKAFMCPMAMFSSLHSRKTFLLHPLCS